MAIQRIDIERALDELASQEEGMRFQGLAVVLGKMRWRELIAHQRKKDFGLDAYAPPRLTPEKIGKGLAASITPTLKKISADAQTAKENFPDLKALLFVTSAKVGNSDRRKWEKALLDGFDLELYIIEREEIIALMMMPENESLCAGFLHLDVHAEPRVAELADRVRRAADVVARTWASKTKGHPLIDLTVVLLNPDGSQSTTLLSLEQIDQALSQGRRLVLEGPAGRGKTTTLIQIALRNRTAGIPFIVELPPWTSSGRGILEYIAGMPQFQAESLTTTDLARVQQTEPFLFLLNGWNEIAESNSSRTESALREVERDFPSAGVIVATRTHHLAPPLPGAIRLQLLPLRRAQRAAYLEARLGTRGSEISGRIDADPSLDDLTRTPFVLSEVASLFEAGAPLPSTKFDILAEILRLQEQRDEHRNSLHAAPIFDRQTNYLSALAMEMTHHGGVTLPDPDARTAVATVARELSAQGQIEPVGGPAVLATLTAHHVLELSDYPLRAYQFEHQQLQEYYAAVEVRARLFDLPDDDHDAATRFTADYVNLPAWTEPLCMIAATFGKQTGEEETDTRNRRAGRKLVEMAVTVDLVLAGELAHFGGPTVWNEIRRSVGDRLRTVYGIDDGSFRQYALAGMVATGADDFRDIILPLLSGQDQETRLSTYRLRPDFRVSLIGSDWREQVRGWSDNARAYFVSELPFQRADGEIAAFAAKDDSMAVRKAAVFPLIWNRSDDALRHVVESLDELTFEEVVRNNAIDMPAVLRPRTIATLRKFIETTTDPSARLRTTLDLIGLGETGLDGVLKDAIEAMSGGNFGSLDLDHIQSAIEHLHKTDPAWVSEWVAVRLAEGTLYNYERWLPFATAIPRGLVEKYLQRLETEDFKNTRFEGMAAAIASGADAEVATHVFAKVRELRRLVDTEIGQPLEFERQVMRQVETVFRQLPGDVAAKGILSSVTSGDTLDIKVAAHFLSNVGRQDQDPLRIADADLKARLRAYLKSSVDLLLRQDDFSGQEKADLASSIAQVGNTEDMADLERLIRADIERMRRGRAAWAAGDHGPLGNGGNWSFARGHIDAIMQLDPMGVDQVLTRLLSEPEYVSDVAGAMMRDFVSRPEGYFDRALRYDILWAARDSHTPLPRDNHRRERYAAALNAEIKRLRDQSQTEKPAYGLNALTKALAAIDGRGSSVTVLDIVATLGQLNDRASLEATEFLLMGGVIVPATPVFSLVDRFLKRTDKWMEDSDRWLLIRILALCPFVDDPAAGIAKMGEALDKRQLRRYDFRDLVKALGESRSDSAIDLLRMLAADAQTFEQCQEHFINAFATLDTPRTRDLLLGFVDPNIIGIAFPHRLDREDILVMRLAELGQSRPEVARQLVGLCERELPELNREILSKVMHHLGTPEALAANLNLLNDARTSPIPRGIRDQLESAFVERRPYGQRPNTFTLHARASNELRVRLFTMVTEDKKRWKSAFELLGQIEEWRLENGRPPDEPRHPDLESGQPWPPKRLFLS